MKVFIVEDAEVVCEALKMMLSEIPGVEVVGSAADERGGLERIGATRPDVVVLDIGLQSGSGMEVLRVVKKRSPATKVIMLTNYTDEIYQNLCMDTGADRFFDKSHEFMRVGEVIREWLPAGYSGPEAASNSLGC